MKMIKLLAALAVMGVASVYGEGNDLIYWQLGDTDITYHYATIDAYLDDETILNLKGYGSSQEGDTYFFVEPGNTVAAGLFDSEHVETFFVQLWYREDEATPATSVGWQSYAKSLIPSTAFSQYDTIATFTPYVFTGIVPEPTSGLLLLFGVAGLALRRRRQTARESNGRSGLEA